jgi:2-hydroxychromene-2-carboxylate isomerase
MKDKRIRIYFSFRSPYSWFAMHRLNREGLGPDAAIEYLPFFEPNAYWSERLRKRGGEFLYTPMRKEKHYYILQDIRRLAVKHRFPLVWPIDKNPDWSVPHLTYLACRHFNLHTPFFWRVYRERWEKGTDIWLWENMRRILRELTEAAEAIIAAAQGETVGALAEDALFAIYADDVFGVPYFIHGRDRFWGLDRLPDFLNSLGEKVQTLRVPEYPGYRESKIPKPPPEKFESLSQPYETDHAGGCG